MIATRMGTIAARWPLVIITIEDKRTSMRGVCMMIVCGRSGRSAMRTRWNASPVSPPDEENNVSTVDAMAWIIDNKRATMTQQ